MFTANFHRRAAVDSFLMAVTLPCSSAPAIIATPSPLPFSDPFLDQFLPRRTFPDHHLHPKLRFELIRYIVSALKSDSQCSIAASSMLLRFNSVPLAGFLHSLRDPRPALSYLLFAFPDLSSDDVAFSCDAVFIFFSADSSKTLAQDILSGLLHRMSSFRSMELLSWAVLHRTHSSRYQALHLVLRAFLGAGMISEALQALSEMRRYGYTPSLSVHSILLRLLFRSGHSNKAWKMFRDMMLCGPLPSIKTFNAMILGSCLKGKIAAGEALIWLIIKSKLQPDACSFNIVMKAHCSYGSYKNAFKLFDEMLDLGLTPTVISYNILINALCRQGRMEEARSWFDSIMEAGLETSIITYNVLLDGYMKSGKIKAANSTYEEMVKNGIPPDLYTFNILLSGHQKFHRDLEILIQNLFKDAINDEVCSHMLISRLCWNGQIELARSLIHRDAINGVIPSVAVFNTVIAGYSKEGMEDKAFSVYKVMVDEYGISPSASTWQSLLLGLCRGGRLDEAKELLYAIAERGFYAGIHAFTIFIDGCFRFGKISDAIDCLNYMEEKGINLDLVGLSAYINGLCRLESMEAALKVYHAMRGRGLIANNFIYNSLISGLFRTGHIEEALNMEADMRSDCLMPDIFTANIVINSFCLQRCLEMADNELRKMEWNGLYPDIVTFNTLIAACYRALDTGRAERYFELMAYRDCKPDIFTYNIRIHGLCSSFKTPEAMKMVDLLFSEGFTPNTVTHNTVLDGICADSLGRAMILTGKLIKMAIVPNIVTVNLLLSHYCRQGMAERALVWAEKFKKVSFDFDEVTLHILDRAKSCLQSESEANGKYLFLEFLMHLVYELICNNNERSKHEPLKIASLVDMFNGVPKMMDVR